MSWHRNLIFVCSYKWMYHVRSNQCIVKWCEASPFVPHTLCTQLWKCNAYDIHWITHISHIAFISLWNIGIYAIATSHLCECVSWVSDIQFPVSAISPFSIHLFLFFVYRENVQCLVSMTLWIWYNVYQTRSMLQQ